MDRAFRRRIGNSAFIIACGVATVIALCALGFIFWSLFYRGFGGLNLNVFLLDQPASGSVGGLYNGIIGSIIMCGIAMIIAVTIGILAGTWLSEYAGNSRYGKVVRFLNDVLLSAPSILIGLFIWQMLVFHVIGHFSGFAGAVALALLATPIVD